MYCVNLYPAPLNIVRLNAIKEYKKKFRNSIAIGYSDHTEGIEAAAIALSFGAKVIEKHFTLSKKNKGPDIKCSIDSQELEKLILISNNINSLVFRPKKENKEENVTKNFAFHSVVAKRDIYPGEFLNFENLTTKRPATGDFHANDIYKLVNKKVKKMIRCNFQIKKKYLK